ncbi:HIR complex subunit [Zalaria obscura]|uniref:HIR complex subunit n=1 Tax=Zalaria obscura TaxID=2024903 RepID=A0ACC3SPB9_9PEZI
MQAEKMDVDEAASSRSSSLSLPPSPHANSAYDDVIRVQHPQLLSGVGVAASPQSKPEAANSAKNTATPDATKVRKPRKKKEPDSTAKSKPDEKPKEKKARKPRTVNPNGTTAAPRKKQKTAEQKTAEPLFSTNPDRSNQKTAEPLFAAPNPRPTIAEMVGMFQTPMARTPVVKTEPAINRPLGDSHEPQHTSSLATSRPASSGQRYDPIRAMTMDAPPPASTTPSLQASPRIHRASASPAIASLIDPPQPTPALPLSTPLQTQTQTQTPRMHSTQSQPQPPVSTSPRLDVTRPGDPQQVPAKSPAPQKASASQLDGATELKLCDNGPSASAPVKSQDELAVSKASSSTATPKAARPTPPSSRVQQNRKGLLSSSDLFGGPKAIEDDAPRRGVNIDITIRLNPMGGNTINIAQEIMKKYGADAINPRAAAHHERMLKIAAAADRLESEDKGKGKGKGKSNGAEREKDEDLVSDLDNDSNTEMGGMDEDKGTGTEDANGEQPKRRRRRKVEDYDKEDDFIDDTELAWQEQAAVAKDGFFVYSGPLVPEGEKAKIEGLLQSALYMAPIKEKAEKAEKLSPSQSADLVLNYLRSQNRPYSAADISANLKNRVTKTNTAKLLKDLHEKQRIEGRTAGKQIVYHVLQDPADAASPEELKTMEDEIARLEEDTATLRDDRGTAADIARICVPARDSCSSHVTLDLQIWNFVHETQL